MILRRDSPPEYIAWNERWHAPFGRREVMRTPTFRRWPRTWQARALGPFGFQPNNIARAVEYPWAYFAAPPTAGMKLAEIGGAMGGFQFALAATGAEVVNVDPLVNYGSGPYDVDPVHFMRTMNRAFGTNVRLIPTTIDKAALPAAHFDVIYCISTIEHLDDAAIADITREARRVLRPGGLWVLTIDLFLDTAPFTSRPRNRWGRNVSVRQLVELSAMELVIGTERELLGFPHFSTDAVLSSLSEYFIGSYPAITQALILRR